MRALALLALAPALLFGAGAGAEAEDDVEEIVVFGVRTGVLLDHPSSSTTVIDMRDFEGEHKRVEDLLAEAVGVQVRRFGGEGERSEVSIRGSTSSQVVILLDGVRLNTEQSGVVDLSSIPVEFIERIEILRGGGSVEQGSGAVGGVINIVTRRPGSVPVTSASLTGGSFGTWTWAAQRAARAGPVDYNFGYSGFKTDGDYEFLRPVFVLPDGQPNPLDPDRATRINNRSERHSLSAGLGAQVSERSYLSLRENASYRSQGEPGLDPGIAGANAGQRAEAHLRSFRSLTQLEWEGSDFGRLGTELGADLFFRFERTRFVDPVPFCEACEPIDVTTDNSTLGIDLSDVWEGDFLYAEHRFLAALQGRLDAIDSSDAIDPSDAIDERRGTLAVALQEEARFFDKRLIFVPGVRLDWTEGIGVNWIPALGIVASPLPWLRFKANIGRAFRAPSFDELFFPDKGFARGNPDLEPERARNADVGFELAFAQLGPLSDLFLETSYFHRKIDDSIVWFLVSTSVLEPRNTGKLTEQGVEFAAALAFTRFLRVSANLTYLDATIDATRVPLPGRAPLESNLRMEVGRPTSWKLVGEMHYTGEMSLNEGGTIRTAARTIWGASAALDLASLRPLRIGTWFSRLWLTFKVSNIGDISVRDARFFPQPGRSLLFGVEGAL